MTGTRVNVAETASFRSREPTPVAPLSDIVRRDRTTLVTILTSRQALIQPRGAFVREHVLTVHKFEPLSRTLTIDPFRRRRHIVTEESAFIARGRINIVVHRRWSISRRFRRGGV